MALPTTQNDGQITTKEQLFALSFIKSWDSAQAYLSINPGSDKRKAKANGNSWLRKPVVKDYLKELSSRMIEDSEDEARAIVEETKAIAFFNPIDYIDIDDSGEPSLNLKKCMANPNIMRLLKIEFGIGVTKDGDRVPTYKVSAYDKDAALEKLYKLHKLYMSGSLDEQTRQIIVNVSFPVPGQHWSKSEAIDSEDIDL